MLPVAKLFASALNATDMIGPVCPFSVAFTSPESTSQTFAVLSQLPEANVLPSAEKATEYTRSVCPLKVARAGGPPALERSPPTRPRPAASHGRLRAWV